MLKVQNLACLHAYKALVFASKLSHSQLINADGGVVT